MRALILAGGVAVAVAVVLFLLAGGDDSRTIEAEFAATNELRSGDPVRVGGVEVGEVEEIRLNAEQESSVVSLKIENEDVELRRDAKAVLRWGTLLGGSFYVDLQPGSPSAPGDDSGSIPRGRTSSQVEFDDLNQPLDGPTAHAFRSMLQGLDRGLGKPDAAGAAIEAVSPSLATVERGVEPLIGRRRDDLRRLVRATGHTAAALGTDLGALRQLLEGVDATLAVTATRRDAVGRFLARSPSALESTQATLDRLQETLDLLDPLVARLRPGVRALDPALKTAAPTLDHGAELLLDARPLLRRLGPAADALEAASLHGVPLFATLTPPLRRLDEELLPWLSTPDPDSGRSTAEMIGPTFGVAGAAASEFDGEGYWLHFPAPGDERTFASSPCQTHLSNPTETEKVRCDALEQVLENIFGGPPTR